jgi:hypothetical protein
MNAPVARKHPIGSSSRQQDRAAARAARTSASRLTGCLAAGVGAGIVGTAPAEAGIVQIDIGLSGFNIGGINGGVTAGTYATTSNFPLTGAGSLRLANGDQGAFWGVSGVNSLEFAASTTDASPTKFTAGQSISGSAAFQQSYYKTSFRVSPTEASPDFGAGSYMGFRTAQNNYGWLEVTWGAASNQFQILSGAYESVANTPITIPAVPEPTTIALTGVAALTLGAGAIRRARKARRESAATA